MSSLTNGKVIQQALQTDTVTKNTVVSLCDLTGHAVQPWLDAGYKAVLVDPQHPEGISTENGITRIGHIIDHPVTWSYLSALAAQDCVAFMASFPPCTDLAVSGARWFKHKAQQNPVFQYQAMQVVWQCHVVGELLGAPYFIENPVSQISSYWRKPDYSFHPYEYTLYEASDNYTKKTCLWTGNGFTMPQVAIDTSLGQPDNRIHAAAPGPDRANFRSATPKGFAKAVFKSNASAHHFTLHKRKSV